MQKKILLIAAALFLCAFDLAAYGPSFKVPFQFDDAGRIEDNPYVHLTRLNVSSLYRAAFQDFRQNRPVANLSFALNYYFNRLNPVPYHVVNFALLVFTALGVWLVLSSLLVHLGYERGRAELAGWLGALVWSVHPVNVQAVTYIVQRHSSMAGFFSIWSLYCYHLSLERKHRAWPLAVVAGVCWLLAILSKESAAGMPVLLFIYKLLFFDRPGPGRMKRNWKWLALLGVYFMLGASVMLRPEMRQLISGPAGHFSRGQRLLTAPRSLLWYLSLIIFPFPHSLALAHDFQVSRNLIQPWTTSISLIIVLALVGLAFLRGNRWPVLSFSIFWYLGQLLVESMPLPIDVVNEQRLYLASLSLVAPAICLPVLKARKPALTVALVMTIALFFGFFSYDRNQLWRDKELVWKDSALKSPGSGSAWNYYCYYLLAEGKSGLAGHACAISVQADPSNPDAWNNFGNCFLKSNDWQGAEKQFQMAVKLSPGFAAANFNLAFVKMQERDWASAEGYLDKTLELKPKDANLYFQMGKSYRKLGRPEKALVSFKGALALAPEWVEPRVRAALVLAEQGKCPEAAALVRESPTPDSRFGPIISNCR